MLFEKLKGFLKLVRWFHLLLAVFPFVSLYFIIAYYTKQAGLSCELSGFNFLILCFCVQLLIAAGCVHNDIMDRDIDKINKPVTHVVDNAISYRASKIIFAVLTALILVFSIYISLNMFWEWTYISLSVYLLSLSYNIYLKRSPLFGNILMAFLAAFIPLVILFFAKECMALLNNQKLYNLVYIYAAFPFLIIIPRELSLDISDIEGDRAAGCKTLPIVIGIEKSRQVVIAFILLIIFLSFIVMYYWSYLTFPFAVVDLLLIVYMLLFKKTKTRIEYIRIGRFLWFAMILGLIGFTITSI